MSLVHLARLTSPSRDMASVRQSFWKGNRLFTTVLPNMDPQFPSFGKEGHGIIRTGVRSLKSNVCKHKWLA